MRELLNTPGEAAADLARLPVLRLLYPNPDPNPNPNPKPEPNPNPKPKPKPKPNPKPKPVPNQVLRLLRSTAVQLLRASASTLQPLTLDGCSEQQARRIS